MTRNFLLATALSLAIALGGLAMLNISSAQASSFDGATFSAMPVTDAEACSTHGYYDPGPYPYGHEILVPTVTTVPFASPYWGYPWWGASIPVVTATVVTLPAVAPPLPDGSQPYLTPTHVNYACNAFSNCQPVANSNGVVCPGNPAAIALNSSLTSATCGSATNIDAKVTGPAGLIVADGTPVLFSTTLGLVPGDTTTDDGIASVSLVFPPKTSGVATVTVTSGTAKAEAKINVTC